MVQGQKYSLLKKRLQKDNFPFLSIFILQDGKRLDDLFQWFASLGPRSDTVVHVLDNEYEMGIRMAG